MRNHSSIYTLESHINFLQEVKGAAEACIETQLLGHDAKHLRIKSAGSKGYLMDPLTGQLVSPAAINQAHLYQR